MLKVFEKIKENAKCIAKVVGISAVTLGACAVEFAGTIELMNKICDGCDEDNPANFAQTVGACAVALGGSAAECATMYGGMYLAVEEITENWK